MRLLFFHAGRAYVHFSGYSVRSLLVTLSRVLRAGLSPPVSSISAFRPAYLPWVLLACYGKFDVQPFNILLDEQ